jgi:hypothetical protein
MIRKELALGLDPGVGPDFPKRSCSIKKLSLPLVLDLADLSLATGGWRCHMIWLNACAVWQALFACRAD